jgi:nitroreductase
MKKYRFYAIILAGFLIYVPFRAVIAQSNVQPLVLELAKPELSKSFPLLKALNERKTNREITSEPITDRQLSEILWAANGMNRPDGKRTAPSTQNRQMTDVYVVLETGIFFYNPTLHNLTRIAEGDHRKLAGTQPFVQNAPVNLVFVSDLAKFNSSYPPEDLDLLMWAGVEAGAQAQNVYLYGASEGLAVIIRGSVNREELGKVMGLSPEKIIVVAQTIGMPDRAKK